MSQYQGYGGQQQGQQQGGYGQYNPYAQQDNRYESYSGQGQQGGYGARSQPYDTIPEPVQTNSSYYGEQESQGTGRYGKLL